MSQPAPEFQIIVTLLAAVNELQGQVAYWKQRTRSLLADSTPTAGTAVSLLLRMVMPSLLPRQKIYLTRPQLNPDRLENRSFTQAPAVF